MTAPITCEGSAPSVRTACEKNNDIYTSKDFMKHLQSRSLVLPGGGLAPDDKELIVQPMPNDCRGTKSPKHTTLFGGGDANVNLNEVLPAKMLPTNTSADISKLSNGQLPVDEASKFKSKIKIKTTRKKTCSKKRKRKRKKRKWMERTLEDIVGHSYNFTLEDPASTKATKIGPSSIKGNSIECQDILSGTVTDSSNAVQLWDQNLLETIPQFPKVGRSGDEWWIEVVESFEIDNSASMLAPLQYHTLNEMPTLDGIAILPETESKYPWVCKEEKDMKQNLDMTIRIMSGGPTPHMVAVGVGGRDEINLKADRKTQTANRIRRLDILSRTGMAKGGLSTEEEEEKKRLLKLEKNRRAAQISREKKKRYILNLERRAAMMGKHLAALELENNQLRALLLSLSKRSNSRRSLPSISSNSNSLSSNTSISVPSPIVPKVEPLDY